MKIIKDEFQNYLNSCEYKHPFNWMEISTDEIKEISDELLLGNMCNIKSSQRGFGLIAELCKRFNASK